MTKHLRQPPFVYFGGGAMAELCPLLERLKITKPFVVLDSGVAASSVADYVTQWFPAGSEIFTGTKPDPDVELVDLAARLAKQHSADGVVGVGGGSAMDLAKAVAVMATNPGRAETYQGFHLVQNKALPKVMIPTTTGTGAEATWSAVLVNRKLNKKGGINSPHVMPDAAILDPRVTMIAPRAVALSSCVDALTHALESYIALNATPMSRVCSDAALRLLLGSIERACDPAERTEDVMLNMLQGSYWAAIAIGGSETGPCHALGYPLTLRYSVPHGLCNAILLPAVMDYNLAHCTAVYAIVAELLEPSTCSLGIDARAQAAPGLVRALLTRLGLNVGLRDYGVAERDLALLSEEGLKLAGPVANAPRPLDAGGAHQILAASLNQNVTPTAAQ